MSSCSPPPQNEIAQSIFLRLPLEIRRMIYKLLFRKRQLDITKFARTKRASRVPRPFFSTGILGTCKQISDEALDVLYGENKFIVRIEAGSFPELSVEIGLTNLSRIRNLHIFAYSRDSDISRLQPCRRGWKIDSHLWKCLLGNVQQLILSFQQPFMFFSGASELEIKKNTLRWIAFLELFLPFLARSIDKDTGIIILDEGLPLTAQHVAKYFRPLPKDVRGHTAVKGNINGKHNFQYESRLLDYSG